MLSEAFGGAADVAEKRARVQADNAEGPSAAIDALCATPPFDEAEARLLEEIIGFPDRPRPLIEFALMADQRKDVPEALKRWTAVRERFPERREGHLGIASALQLLERPGEAEPILAAAAARFPEWLHPLQSHAFIAQQRQDWPEAAARWEQVRARFPGDLNGYVFGAGALIKLQRQDEAEALLSEAVGRFPDRPQPLIAIARMAHQRQDWPEALRRWTAVRERFPDTREGHEGSAWALDAMERSGEAEPIWAEAIVRFPESFQPPKSHAFIAHGRRDWPEACVRWELMRARFPGDPAGYTFGAAALVQLQRQDEAAALLNEAVARFPDRPEPLADLARLAQQRGDWAEALSLFEAAQRLLPGNSGIAAEIEAVKKLAAETAARIENVPAAASPADAAEAPAPIEPEDAGRTDPGISAGDEPAAPPKPASAPSPARTTAAAKPGGAGRWFTRMLGIGS